MPVTIDPIKLKSFLQGLIEKASIPAISYAHVGPSATRDYALRIQALALG